MTPITICYGSIWLCIVFFLFIGPVTPLAYSDQFDPARLAEIQSSPNPLGSGARALGMGSAFIAVADDATAASWNPGGLIQLELPEISVVGAYFDRVQELDLEAGSDSPDRQNISDSRVNFLSATYPFNILHRNMVVSITYQNLYDFSGSREFSVEGATQGVSESRDFSYRSKGSLSAYGLAYAIQVTPRFSFGLTFNVWADGIYKNQWDEERTLEESGVLDDNPFESHYESKDTYSMSGMNANFGILWHLNSRLTMGAVLKTPFEADIKHDFTSEGGTWLTESELQIDDFSFADSEDMTLHMPMSYGIGVAYRFSDVLTVSADFYRTEWQDFVLEDSEGNKTSPISNKPIDDSDIDATCQARSGIEYLLMRKEYIIPIRGGLFYDPKPAESSPDDYYGFSLGSGLTRGRWVFDLAYQCRLGDNVSVPGPDEYGASQDVTEHNIYASLIIYFN